MRLSLRRSSQLIFGAILLASAQQTFGSEPPLSQKAFEKLGVNAMIAQILNVQVTSSAPGYEVGTVEVQPIQVLRGIVTVPTLILPFQRVLWLSDSPANWDNVAPLGASLTTEIGERLLIYFNEENGTYSLFPASNAVQSIKEGLVLGKIVSVQRETAADWHHHPVEVTIEVKETVFGWEAGTVITLPLANPELDNDGAIPSAGDTNIAIGNASGNLADNCVESQGRLVLAYFSKGRIMGLKVADGKVLRQIRLLDLQGG